MPARSTKEIESKTAALIQKRFNVPSDYAQRLAVAALDGIDAHGCDASDWDTIVETVRVVVASWIANQTFK